MGKIAICEADVIHAIVRNAKSIGLPNGRSTMGPLKRLPFAYGPYTIRSVIETGPLPGEGETQSNAPAVINGDFVVIERTISPPSAEWQLQRLLEYIPSRRFDAETGGLVWNGWRVDTDRASQSKIGNAYALARDGYWPEGSGWKFKDGVYRVLSAAQAIELALAVAGHVQTCFATESTLSTQAVEGTITTIEQVNAALPVLPAPEA